MITALKRLDYRRAVENRRTAVRARELARFDCWKLGVHILAGLTVRESVTHVRDIGDVLVSAAELDGGALVTRH